MKFSEEMQKCVDVETICELLNLVLGSQFCAQVDSITEYLKVGFLSTWMEIFYVLLFRHLPHGMFCDPWKCFLAVPEWLQGANHGSVG